MGIDYAARARALVGTRFRAQGRGSDGLDCVGLALATFNLPASSVRDDYQLRGDHLVEAKQVLRSVLRRIPSRQRRPGDLMLLHLGHDQLHLAVCTDGGFVHAHVGLRRVVETPGEPQWPIVAIYRRRRRA